MRWILTVLLLGVFDGSLCGFFDYTDIDDPFQLLWNAKNQVAKETNTPCLGNVSYVVMEGVCKSHPECQLSGGASTGVAVGSCGLLSTCCIYMGSCGKTSAAKISYFRSSETWMMPKKCTYQVKLQNRNICQLRLDFVEMALASPAEDEPNIWTCRDEKFFVEGRPELPQFCGRNTGQHMYIPVNGNDITPVTLHIDLGDRLVNSGWNIKVTQLSCPGTSSFPYRNQINAMMLRDYPILAPQGCLQYFTDLRGSFRSFGFDLQNPNASVYNVNQTYAICFKRYPGICGIRFAVDYFKVAREPGSNADPSDYLYVPALRAPSTPWDGRVSGPQAKNSYLISDTPGPLYVYFASDSNNTDITTESGFNIKYELASQCLRNS